MVVSSQQEPWVPGCVSGCNTGVCVWVPAWQRYLAVTAWSVSFIGSKAFISTSSHLPRALWPASRDSQLLQLGAIKHTLSAQPEQSCPWGMWPWLCSWSGHLQSMWQPAGTQDYLPLALLESRSHNTSNGLKAAACCCVGMGLGCPLAELSFNSWCMWSLQSVSSTSHWGKTWVKVEKITVVMVRLCIAAVGFF